ncbi:MAG TPA: YibE/F family protein [Candidatus Dojkabacteria bacterium]|nr:YibE/F family protein [Candidatus Dojkabacteria bacterium]
MKKIFVLISLFIFTSFNLISAEEIPNDPVEEITHFGVVSEIVSEEKIIDEVTNQEMYIQVLKVKIDNAKDDLIEVNNGDQFDIRNTRYKKGDNVIIKGFKDITGNVTYRISETNRSGPLLFIALAFSVLAIIIARKKGIYSLLSLVFSFIIIFTILLPMLVSGKDPLVSVILSSLILLPVIFYLSHGFNTKTTIAIIATLSCMILTGILANIFIDLTNLQGYTSDESYLLKNQIANFDMRNLLLAGMIISSLGILDDITVSQISIVFELHALNPDLKIRDLYSKGMNVGKDHIASMINTLVLVYAGSSLPLLLLFINNPLPAAELISFEMLATEIVKTLVGSIGLILAVPAATMLASYYLTKMAHKKVRIEEIY